MTSTSFNTGYSLSRNSSKVIQPPGGQTADIFGSRGAEPSYSSASSQAGSDVASSRVHIETDQQSVASSNQTPVDGLMRQQSAGNMSPTGSSIGSSSVVSGAAPQQSILMVQDYKPTPQQQQQFTSSVQQQQLQQDVNRTPKKSIPVVRRNPITGEIYENPAERQQAPIRVRQPPGGSSSITF